MIEINSNNIIVGQIKELLSSFNLPTCRIYTKENKINAQHHGKQNEPEKNIVPTVKRKTDSTGYPVNMQYVPYIKDGTIQYYIYDKDKTVTPYYWENTNKTYFYNQKQINFTKNLRINNNIYDSYTHEYLGNYLRFQRDYNNINLMSLYNCFSDRICNNLSYSFKTSELGPQVVFDTTDPKYKIYMIPVKLFQAYTIAIDCQSEVEMCCGLYGKYQDKREKVASIPIATYKKYNNLIFSQPVLYTALQDLFGYIQANSLVDLAKNENDLKLFIKLPANLESSIAVLEGDYRRYNDSILNYKQIETKKLNTLKRTQNYSITNFDTSVNDFSNFKPISALQLLRLNTNKSYAFADRLIEYLCGNVVDSTEEILDNVRRVQKTINLNVKNPDDCGKKLNQDLAQNENGVWSDSIRAIVYDKFNSTDLANNNDKNHDILGYIDKEIESIYTGSTGKQNKSGKMIYTTISAIDLYSTADGLYSSLVEDD